MSDRKQTSNACGRPNYQLEKQQPDHECPTFVNVEKHIPDSSTGSSSRDTSLHTSSLYGVAQPFAWAGRRKYSCTYSLFSAVVDYPAIYVSLKYHRLLRLCTLCTGLPTRPDVCPKPNLPDHQPWPPPAEMVPY